MIVKAIYKNEERNYFRDKTTAEKIEDQVKRTYGDIFECDDNIAEERIDGGFVVEATDEEKKQYVDSITTIDEKDQDKPLNLEELSFKELKALAKSKNLKYVGISKKNLIKSINESESGEKE